MDDPSLEIVAAVSEGAVRGFLETVGAPVVELSLLGSDLIRRQRVKTEIKTARLAKEMLEEAGIDPQAIALKVLVPLLEGASLESDAEPAMQRRWASLLANAAAGEGGAQVLPSFPRILSELSPEEATILDTLYRGAAWPNFVGVQADELRATAGLEVDDLFIARLRNLERLDLCDGNWENVFDREGMTVDRERPHLIEGTSLGFRFVAACAPPTSSS